MPTTDPATWPTYHDPSGLFAIRYPTGWFEREGDFYSKNPDTFTGPPDLPAGVVKLEITHAPDDQLSGCGPLERDLETGDLVPTQPASPTDVLGVPGWREINQSPEYGRLTRIDSITTIYEGECWLLAGYSTEALPNEVIFEDIAKTFKFAFGPAADS